MTGVRIDATATRANSIPNQYKASGVAGGPRLELWQGGGGQQEAGSSARLPRSRSACARLLAARPQERADADGHWGVQMAWTYDSLVKDFQTSCQARRAARPPAPAAAPTQLPACPPAAAHALPCLPGDGPPVWSHPPHTRPLQVFHDVGTDSSSKWNVFTQGVMKSGNLDLHR